MRLNHDCIRDFLLEIEDSLGVNEHLFLGEILKMKCVEKYGKDDVFYTILKLKEANFINCSIQHTSNEIYMIIVSSITYEGHLFLDNVRDHKVWKKTKEITSKVSSASLSTVSTIASETLKSFIQGHLSL